MTKGRRPKISLDLHGKEYHSTRIIEYVMKFKFQSGPKKYSGPQNISSQSHILILSILNTS